MNLNKSFILLFLLGLMACSGLIKKSPNRRMLGEEEQKQVDEDEFQQFRRGPSSDSTNYINPKTKRQYRTADEDRENISLWTGRGTDSYLFTNQTEKQLGDIILIDVMKKLKKEIATELKLSEVYDRWERQERKKEGEKKEETAPAKEEGSSDEPKDHISSIVEEEINRTHVLLKGRKTVLYKKKKKLIEFKGLVARKDITKEDTISSDKILESTVKVIR